MRAGERFGFHQISFFVDQRVERHNVIHLGPLGPSRHGRRRLRHYPCGNVVPVSVCLSMRSEPQHFLIGTGQFPSGCCKLGCGHRWRILDAFAGRRASADSGCRGRILRDRSAGLLSSSRG
jgi:hypothetical protein